jgi:hypothetical protein
LELFRNFNSNPLNFLCIWIFQLHELKICCPIAAKLMGDGELIKWQHEAVWWCFSSLNHGINWFMRTLTTPHASGLSTNFYVVYTASTTEINPHITKPRPIFNSNSHAN